MTMKRTLSALFASVLVAGMLAGCGGGSTETSPSADASAESSQSSESEATSEEASPSAEADAQEASSSEEKVLNIFTWATYIPDDVIADFEADTGIKINYSNFDTNENMLAKLSASGGADYDIVLASDYIISMAIDENLAQPLNKEAIPNYANLDEAYLSKFYDPNNEYTVPYGPGSPLLIYDPALVDTTIEGYSDLWNADLASSIVMLDNPRVVIGTVLMANGYSMNSTDTEELNIASGKLMELKPNIAALDGDNPQAKLASGEASVGYVFTSQIVSALAERPDLEVVYPKEGVGFGIDAMFIPAKAPHPENANIFLNYILDAERAAHISEAIGYLCPNKAAQEYLSEEYKSNPAYNIPSEMIAKAEFIEVIPAEAQLEYDRIWTEFTK